MKTILLAAILLLLSGCETPPKVEYRYKNVLIQIPSNFIADCDIAPPPPIDEYLKADADKREELWTKAFRAATEYVIECNARMKNARKWSENQREIFRNSESEKSEK